MSNEETPNPPGRPPISAEEKEQMVRKLEPYLKSGLSIRKSLGEAQISKTSFYKVMDEDEEFRDKINTFRNFVAVLANNIIISELQNIIQKQNGYKDKNGKDVPAQKLTGEDKNFVWKFVLTSNLTKEEFGERKDVSLFDPEAEIQKIKGIIEETYSDEIDHSDD